MKKKHISSCYNNINDITRKNILNSNLLYTIQLSMCNTIIRNGISFAVRKVHVSALKLCPLAIVQLTPGSAKNKLLKPKNHCMSNYVNKIILMLFMSCFCYAFVRVCLLMSCGHLLGKG